MRPQLIRKYASIPFEKPQITGAGPFAERPKFHAIGHPSKILSISFPQSSRIYLSQTSILASNVELNTIHADIRTLHGSVYQCLKSSEAANVLVHGQSQYRVLEVGLNDWTVFDSRRIIGWTGTDVKFQGLAPQTSHRSVSISGRGAVVLDSTSEIFNLQVDANDEVFINPNALIAINSKDLTTLRPEVLNPGTYELHRLEIPHFDWPSWVTNYVEKMRAMKAQVWAQLNPRQFFAPIAPYLSPVKRQLQKLLHWVYVKINGRLIRRNPIYFKVTGPATILIDNQQMLANNKLFTSREITMLFKNQG